MAQERATLRKPPAVERRPPKSTVHLSPVSVVQPARSPASAPTGRPATSTASVSVSAPISVQCARISSPNDSAEVEARDTARKVVQMAAPARPAPVKADDEAKKGKEIVQRSAAGPARASSPPASVTPLCGTPLPKPVRSFMEPRFGANFGGVRIHTGEAAAQQSATLNAHAFTVGEHVFF